jgi:hypothetical protein
MRAQLNLWDQCGGINSAARANASDPSACCPVDAHCEHLNQW